MCQVRPQQINQEKRTSNIDFSGEGKKKGAGCWDGGLKAGGWSERCGCGGVCPLRWAPDGVTVSEVEGQCINNLIPPPFPSECRGRGGNRDKADAGRAQCIFIPLPGAAPASRPARGALGGRGTLGWPWPFPPTSWLTNKKGFVCFQLFCRCPNLSGLRVAEVPASV